jgi:hypothetical protein
MNLGMEFLKWKQEGIERGIKGVLTEEKKHIMNESP